MCLCVNGVVRRGSEVRRGREAASWLRRLLLAITRPCLRASGWLRKRATSWTVAVQCVAASVRPHECAFNPFLGLLDEGGSVARLPTQVRSSTQITCLHATPMPSSHSTVQKALPCCDQPRQQTCFCFAKRQAHLASEVGHTFNHHFFGQSKQNEMDIRIDCLLTVICLLSSSFPSLIDRTLPC